MLLEMQMRACPRLTYGHLFHTFPSRLGASLEQISSHICANSVDVLKIYVLIDLNFAGQCVSRGVRLKSASCSTRVLLSNKGAICTEI